MCRYDPYQKKYVLIPFTLTISFNQGNEHDSAFIYECISISELFDEDIYLLQPGCIINNSYQFFTNAIFIVFPVRYFWLCKNGANSLVKRETILLNCVLRMPIANSNFVVLVESVAVRKLDYLVIFWLSKSVIRSTLIVTNSIFF